MGALPWPLMFITTDVINDYNGVPVGSGGVRFGKILIKEQGPSMSNFDAMITGRSILFWASTLAATFSTGQGYFDNGIQFPGDTMQSNGIEMHVIEAANGDLVTTSWHQLYDAPGPDVNIGLLHRFTAAGGTLWRRKINMVAGGQFRMKRACELGDGSWVVTGAFGSPGAGLLMRYDAAGTLLAARQYQAGTFNTEPYDAAPLNDSTLLVICKANDPAIGSLLMRTTTDGDVIDAHMVHQPGAGGTFQKMDPCSDGGYLLSGYGSGTTFPDSSYFNVQIGRVDSTGSLLWAVRLEEVLTSAIFGVAGAHQLPDGSIRVFVRSRRTGQPQTDTWMIALDGLGGLLWKERVRFTGISAGLGPMASVNVGDTAFWLAGGFAPSGRAYAAIDGAGTIIGTSATVPFGISLTMDATLTSDGSLATLALEQAPGSGTGNYPRLIKDAAMPTLCTPYPFFFTYDTLGLQPSTVWNSAPLPVNFSDATPLLNVVAETPQIIANCLTTPVTMLHPQSVMSITPNPASNQVRIEGEGLVSVRIFDATGHMVLFRWLHGATNAGIDLRSMPSGLYHVRVQTDDGWIDRKLIKE